MALNNYRVISLLYLDKFRFFFYAKITILLLSRPVYNYMESSRKFPFRSSQHEIIDDLVFNGLSICRPSNYSACRIRIIQEIHKFPQLLKHSDCHYRLSAARSTNIRIAVLSIFPRYIWDPLRTGLSISNRC